jgi:hypothetical protein
MRYLVARASAEVIECRSLNALSDALPLAVLKEVDRERVVRVGPIRVVPDERLKDAGGAFASQSVA